MSWHSWCNSSSCISVVTLPKSSAAVVYMESYTHVPPSESLAPEYKNKANDQMKTGGREKQKQTVTCDTAVNKNQTIFSWCNAIHTVPYCMYLYCIYHRFYMMHECDINQDRNKTFWKSFQGLNLNIWDQSEDWFRVHLFYAKKRDNPRSVWSLKSNWSLTVMEEVLRTVSYVKDNWILQCKKYSITSFTFTHVYTDIQNY